MSRKAPPPKACVTSRKTAAKETITEPATFSAKRWMQKKNRLTAGPLVHRQVSLSMCHPIKNCISEFPDWTSANQKLEFLCEYLKVLTCWKIIWFIEARRGGKQRDSDVSIHKVRACPCSWANVIEQPKNIRVLWPLCFCRNISDLSLVTR